MLQRVTQYCQDVLIRIGLVKPKRSARIYQWENLRQFQGTVVFYVNRRGFWGIVADDGKKYFPMNLSLYPKVMRDRMRVQVTLEIFPQVSNFYQFGQSARLTQILPLDQVSRAG